MAYSLAPNVEGFEPYPTLETMLLSNLPPTQGYAQSLFLTEPLQPSNAAEEQFKLLFHKLPGNKGKTKTVKPQNLDGNPHPPQWVLWGRNLNPFPYIKGPKTDTLTNFKITYHSISNPSSETQIKAERDDKGIVKPRIEVDKEFQYYQLHRIKIKSEGVFTIRISADLRGLPQIYFEIPNVEVRKKLKDVQVFTEYQPAESPKRARAEEDSSDQLPNKKGCTTSGQMEPSLVSDMIDDIPPTALIQTTTASTIPTLFDQDKEDCDFCRVRRLKPSYQPLGSYSPVYIQGMFNRKPSRGVFFGEIAAAIIDWASDELFVHSPIWKTPAEVDVKVHYGSYPALPHVLKYKYMLMEDHLKTHEPPNNPSGSGGSGSGSDGSGKPSQPDNQNNYNNQPPVTQGPSNTNNNNPQHTTPSQSHKACTPLFTAFQQTKDVNTKDTFNYTALHEVSYAGLLNAVKELLEWKVDVNALDCDGRTPLSWAAQCGHKDIVQYLLDHGAEVDLTEDNGVTPLHVALINDHWEVAKVLLAGGADWLLKASESFNVFQCSGLTVREFFNRFGDSLEEKTSDEQKENKTCIKWPEDQLNTLPQGCELFFQMLPPGKTGRTEILSIRELDHNSQAYPQTCIYGRPLNPFPYLRCPDGLQLLNCKISYWLVSDPSETYTRPIMPSVVSEKGKYAYFQFHGITINKVGLVDIRIEFALENGRQCSVDIPNVDVQSSVRMIRAFRDILPGTSNSNASNLSHAGEVWSTTLRSGGVQTYAEMYGVFPRRPSLTVLVSVGDSEQEAVIEEWRPNKLKVKFPFSEIPQEVTLSVWYGLCGPLQWPQEFKNLTSSFNTNGTKKWQCPPRKTLTTPVYDSSHWNANARNKFGYTALHEVAYLGLMDEVVGLVHRNAYVNTLDCDGRTPLSWAAQCGHIQVVRYLLDHGAIVDLTVADGVTPLHVALLNNHWGVAEILLEHGANEMLKAFDVFDTPLCSGLARFDHETLIYKGKSLKYMTLPPEDFIEDETDPQLISPSVKVGNTSKPTENLEAEMKNLESNQPILKQESLLRQTTEEVLNPETSQIKKEQKQNEEIKKKKVDILQAVAKRIDSIHTSGELDAFQGRLSGFLSFQPSPDLNRVIQQLQNQMAQAPKINWGQLNIPQSAPRFYPPQPQYGYGALVDSPSPTRQMIQKMSQSSYSTHGMDAIQSSIVNFKLFEDPEEYQRKAYKNENRFILPNPLVIMQVKPEGFDRPVLKDCEVSVRLVHLNGEELESDKQTILEGTKHRPMVGSENEKKAEFSLKLLATSGKSKFRLCFTVTYICDNLKYKEIIFSNSFKVISNKKTTFLNEGKRRVESSVVSDDPFSVLPQNLPQVSGRL